MCSFDIQPRFHWNFSKVAKDVTTYDNNNAYVYIRVIFHNQQLLSSKQFLIGQNHAYTNTRTITTIRLTQHQKMIAQKKIIDVLVTYKTNRNIFKYNGEGNNTHNNNRGSKRACTYEEFMNYKPSSFYRYEGMVGLTNWPEIYRIIIPNQPLYEDCRVKFATCTFMGTTLF